MVKFILLFSSITLLLQAQDSKPTGLRFDEKKYYQQPLKESTKGTDLPPSVSLKQYAPTPQFQIGSTCTDWSISYAARTILEARQKGWCDSAMINDNAFGAGFLYALAHPNHQNCREGIDMDAILSIAQEKGIPRLKYIGKHECLTKSSLENLEKEAEKGRIGSFKRLTIPNNTSLSLIKQALSEGHPVVIGMSTTASFNKVHSHIWKPMAGEPKLEEHAVCIIGYRDSTGSTFFDIINSWGTGWGNKGFIEIEASDLQKYVLAAYEITPLATSDTGAKSQLKCIQPRHNKLFILDTLSQNIGFVRFKIRDKVKKFDCLRLIYTHNDVLYTYLFSMDSQQKLRYHAGDSDTIEAGESIVPAKNKLLCFDTLTGKTVLCLITSLQKLNLESLIKTIETDKQGDLDEKCTRALSKIPFCKSPFIQSIIFDTE